MNAAVPPPLRDDAKIIGLVGIAHAISHFFHLILAPLFPWLREAFQLSYSELGLLMSVFFVVSGIGQALAGFIVDRVGARAVLFAGISLLALSAVVLSQAQSYSMLLVGAAIAGTGNSVFHPADLTILNKRVAPGRLGHAFSAHGILGNLGWALAPVFLAPLAAALGWRNALLAAAALAVCVLLLLVWHRSYLSTHEVAKTMTVTGTTSSSDGVLDFLRLPAVWMCFAFFLITAMALGGVQSFSTSSLRSVYGMSLEWATAAYTVFMFSSAAGMLWGGFLSSKAVRHDRTVAMAFGLTGLGALIIASGVMPALLAVILMAAVGFGSGVATPSRDLMIRAAAPPNATGRVVGVVYSGLDTGLAIAPLLFGALMDARQPALVFVGIGVFQFLAVFTAINVGGRTRERQIRHQIV